LTRFPDRASFKKAVELTSVLRNAEFRVAKSMPTIPHAYTLADKWDDREMFDRCDQFIRENGYPTTFFKRSYTYFDIDGYHYWDMAEPLGQVPLINRAKKSYPKHESFSAPTPELQELIAGRLREMKLGRVLEIGIPDSGPILSSVEIHPDDYIGIDSRAIEVSQAEYDHPQHAFVRTCLSDHYRDGYDTILALWGSASRIPGHALDRIRWMLNPGGQAILMFQDDPGLQFGERDVPFNGFVVRKIINADLPQENRP
jgi:hypothetical protein